MSTEIIIVYAVIALLAIRLLSHNIKIISDMKKLLAIVESENKLIKERLEAVEKSAKKNRTQIANIDAMLDFEESKRLDEKLKEE